MTNEIEPISAKAALKALGDYRIDDLETLLIHLCKMGVPSLHKMQNGWWAVLKMHVAAAGTEFTIRSESDNPTPTAAARQCAERAVAALNQWS
jgi:hypothetical protein